MGRYIDDILQPGEKVLYSTTMHWIVYPAGARRLDRGRRVPRGVAHGGGDTWLLVLAVMAGGLGALVAAVLVVTAWFQRWITETDVTNPRSCTRKGSSSARPSR